MSSLESMQKALQEGDEVLRRQALQEAIESEYRCPMCNNPFTHVETEETTHRLNTRRHFVSQRVCGYAIVRFFQRLFGLHVNSCGHKWHWDHRTSRREFPQTAWQS